MKKILIALLSLFCCQLLHAEEAKLTPPANPKVENFTLIDANGKSVSLDSFAGKWVVLEWINFQCPFVKKFYSGGTMQKWQEDYAKRGVVWLTVCSSAKGKPGYMEGDNLRAQLLSQKMKSAHYLIDDKGTLGQTFAAKTTPTMVIISPSKELIYNGALDSINSTNPADIAKAENHLVKTLDEALAGKKLEYRKTVAYGCSVKY